MGWAPILVIAIHPMEKLQSRNKFWVWIDPKEESHELLNHVYFSDTYSQMVNYIKDKCAVTLSCL